MLRLLVHVTVRSVTFKSLSRNSELVFARVQDETPDAYFLRLETALDTFQSKGGFKLFRGGNNAFKGLVKVVNEESSKIVYLLANCPKMSERLLDGISEQIVQHPNDNYYSLVNVGGNDCIFVVLTS
jgi:spore coat polysaccharide biosynthesis protein SpsF (cytidylyltransferase family)